MHLTASHDAIEALWRALTKPDRDASSPEEVARICRDAAGMGWLHVPVIETLVTALEPRLHEIRTRRLLEAFGVQPHAAFPRPKPGAGDIDGAEMVSAIDAAHLLVLLERFGFSVDPAPLCEPLLTVLTTRRYLGATELAVYRHAEERHRLPPVTIATRANPGIHLADEMIVTASGHVAEVFRNAEDRPHALRVTAPLWRPQQRPAA